MIDLREAPIVDPAGTEPSGPTLVASFRNAELASSRFVVDWAPPER
jgi:hypothetical protein